MREASVFERGPDVPVTHMAYIKSATDAFLAELKEKDRRSPKEWGYVNGDGVWVETGLTALDIAKKTTGMPKNLERWLELAKSSHQAELEVMLMHTHYFCDMKEHWIKEARQMDFRVEEGNDDVHLAS